MEELIRFELNGKPAEIRLDPELTLMWVLRNQFGLTGTKYGCGLGFCGACTVLIDFRPVRSCMLAIQDVTGRKVLTIEGLATNGTLHPIQKAFVENDALQCGFCTPGMIMSVYGLLLRNPGPTRQEEFFYDTFLPAAVVKVRAGADLKGKIVLWDYSQYFAGSRGSDTIYDVPHSRTTSYGQGWTAPGVHPFATGPWRAPGNNTNTFGRESQIDILAFRAGIDPLEFRLMNLEDERMIAVLKELAGLFGYSPAKTPSGRGIGIACGTDAGTYVAHIAEVKVDRRTGQIKVERVACAQDMGLCINPQGAATQMEGCIAMGLGYALSEEIKFSGGRIHTRNFATYGLPTFSSMPLIETRILHKPDQPSQGGGEPAIICMGAVLANAVFDATGARPFRLPMTPERVKEALASI